MDSTINKLDYYNSSFTQSASQAKTNKLQNTLNNLEGSSDEELMEACKSFESYFLEQVFNAMEKTVMKDEKSTSDSGYADYFKSQLIQEYASNATESGGYGIAQMLYESMKRK